MKTLPNVFIASLTIFTTSTTGFFISNSPNRCNNIHNIHRYHPNTKQCSALFMSDQSSDDFNPPEEEGQPPQDTPIDPSASLTEETNDEQSQTSEDSDEEDQPIELPPYNPSEHTPDPSSIDLTSQFSALLASRNISSISDVPSEDYREALGISTEEYDAEFDLDEDELPSLSEGDEDELREFTVGDNLDMSDEEFSAELEENVKERMLSSPNSLVNLNSPVEVDMELEDEEEEYVVPEVYPDSGLSAVEVVKLVINALRNNDTPTPNKGIEIFFAYASSVSQVQKEISKGMTPQQYKDFLLFSRDYSVLFDNDDTYIERGDVNYKTKKGYFTVRLLHLDRRAPDVSVNFILSSEEGLQPEDLCWKIDSMLIRPSLRRKLRRS